MAWPPSVRSADFGYSERVDPGGVQQRFDRYFFAFGMQFVLFPSLVAFFLDASPEGVGLAQSALSGPMFCFLLFGGLLAERAKPGPTLALLHLALDRVYERFGRLLEPLA